MCEPVQERERREKRRARIRQKNEERAMAAAAVMQENDEYEVNEQLGAVQVDQVHEPERGQRAGDGAPALAAGPAARFAETVDAPKAAAPEAKPTAASPLDAFQHAHDKPREGEMGDNDVYYWPDEEAAAGNGHIGAAFVSKTKK